MGEWKYDTSTEEAIRSALLALLAKKPLANITVSELAREANVSRSTFYAHFGNPVDVYDAVVDEFARALSPMMSQVACTGEFEPEGEPFCARLREQGPLAPAVGEGRFLSAFIDNAETLEKHDLFGILVGAGYTRDQARALCAFQYAGCFTAARTVDVDEGGWADVKAAIDRFILGGIAALLAAKRA